MKRDELIEAVEIWRLRLTPEWRVVLLDHPPEDREGEDDFLAVSQTCDDYTHIRLYFHRDCLALDREAIDVTIVHELLHALTRPFRTAQDRVSSHLPIAVSMHWRQEREHAEEQFVERLARSIVALTGHPHVGPATVKGPRR